MPIQITLDDVLRRNDMSRRELSRRTGVHRDTVCKYAGNRVRLVSLDLLEAFCTVLHCGLSDLLSDTPEPDMPRPHAPAETVQCSPGTRTHTSIHEMTTAEFERWLDSRPRHV